MKKGLIISIVLGAILVCFCSDSMNTERSGGFVAGVVREKIGHNSVDSVKVILGTNEHNPVGFTAFTDSVGHYSLFSGFWTGKCFIFATKAGYKGIIREVWIIAGDTTDLDLELENESEAGNDRINSWD